MLKSIEEQNVLILKNQTKMQENFFKVKFLKVILNIHFKINNFVRYWMIFSSLDSVRLVADR